MGRRALTPDQESFRPGELPSAAALAGRSPEQVKVLVRDVDRNRLIVGEVILSDGRSLEP
jgi:hypothetical protein